MKNLTLEAKSFILSEYPKEAVGLIKEGIFIPLENIHSDPTNFFQLSEKDSFYISSLGKEVALIHSHTMESFKDDPRTPSYEDMLLKQNIGITCGIVHTDGLDVTDILYYGDISTEPLEGRTYISNVYDCFTLARDYLWKAFSFDVGLHPRPADWQEWNPHYIEQNFAKCGFKEVRNSLKVGDILLFAIGSHKVNHIGIYLGQGQFLHHLYNRKSSTDLLEKWQRQLIKTIRLDDGN